MSDDVPVIAELNIYCSDEKARLLYVKFKNEDDLYNNHFLYNFNDIYDRLEAALTKKYPGQNCVIAGDPQICRTFTILDGGKMMRSIRGLVNPHEIPTQIDMKIVE